MTWAARVGRLPGSPRAGAVSKGWKLRSVRRAVYGDEAWGGGVGDPGAGGGGADTCRPQLCHTGGLRWGRTAARRGGSPHPYRGAPEKSPPRTALPSSSAGSPPDCRRTWGLPQVGGPTGCGKARAGCEAGGVPREGKARAADQKTAARLGMTQSPRQVTLTNRDRKTTTNSSSEHTARCTLTTPSGSKALPGGLLGARAGRPSAP